MPLTKEQLLQKRFKFILPFPGAHWRIGGIFELVGDDLYAVSGLPIKMLGCILEEYPHIFQPLPWWSDRKPEEMPEYIKDETGVIYKSRWMGNPLRMYLDNNMNSWFVTDKIMCFYEPDTEDAYINQKQQ